MYERRQMVYTSHMTHHCALYVLQWSNLEKELAYEQDGVSSNKGMRILQTGRHRSDVSVHHCRVPVRV